MQGDHWIVNSPARFAAFDAHVEKMFAEHHYLRVQIKTGKQRSDIQNNSLHRYCRELAKALNDAGFERSLNTPVGKCQVPWNADSAKENIWRPVQIAMTGEYSTTRPTRQQYVEIYETLNRHFSNTKGLHIPWPSNDEN